jgi:hypothetical protein
LTALGAGGRSTTRGSGPSRREVRETEKKNLNIQTRTF